MARRFRDPNKKSLVGRIFKVLKTILSFPSRVARKYGVYNNKIKEMNAVVKNKKLDEMVSKNYFLINLFIRVPLLVGLLSTGYSIYKDRAKYTPYFNKAVSPIFSTSNLNISNRNLKTVFNRTVKPTVNRVKYIVSENPIPARTFYDIFLGFIISFAGAVFLSKNPAFDKEEKIRGLLANLKYIDENGNPWEFTWTPFAIYFEAYNVDVFRFVKNTRFWGSANFSPTDPVFVGGDQNKFIVQKRYDLPNRLIFKDNLQDIFRELDEGRAKKDDKKDSEES